MSKLLDRLPNLDSSEDSLEFHFEMFRKNMTHRMGVTEQAAMLEHMHEILTSSGR